MSRIDSKPTLDGHVDDLWGIAKPAFLRHYWGELPEDTLDFQAYFKALHNDEYLYIFVDIYDQVKYTAPKPEHEMDLHLWSLWNYDRVNLSFDSNNDGETKFLKAILE